MKWEYIGHSVHYSTELSYFWWELKGNEGRSLYNVTHDRNTPPKNTAGYLNLKSLMRLKGINGFSYP